MGNSMARESAKTDVIIPGTDVNLQLAHLNAHIAAELAAGLSDAGSIRERYGISEAQWNVLKRTPMFRAMLLEAVQKLQGDLNANKRITLKSEIALEDSIPVLHRIAHDPEVVPASRIEAIKQMASLTGRNGKEPAAGGGSGFSLTINLGANTKNVTIDGQKVTTDE